jgi:BirA family transcriptional regulator, biotin operon repressor / biotin---[acetyl-CoA-carboxylase] ligase
LLTEHTVAEAARAAGFPGKVHFREVTGSTNTDLINLAEAGAEEWTVLVTGQQEAGRGRLGRTWVSSPGSSLLLSVLVRPSSPVSDAAVVTLGAGVCMALALAACGVGARCKWPNDLVTLGRKLGGILVESSVRGDRLEYAVIGTGVNINQSAAEFPPDLRDTATSIALEGGQPDAPALLRAYLARVREFCDAADPHFHDRVLDSYRKVCDTLGRTVRASTTSGQHVEGRAVEIGDAGELILETRSGKESVTFGEIVHLD